METTIVSILLACLMAAIVFFTKKEEPVDEIEYIPTPPEPPQEPVERSKNDVLYDFAYSCMGKDMSPQENEYGCAESSYFVMKGAGVPNLPNTPIYSTIIFEQWLDTHFQEVQTPEYGDIRISATRGTNVGHMGVEGKNKIMSNNSRTYKWDDYWGKQAWLDYYTKKKGLKTRYFRWV